MPSSGLFFFWMSKASPMQGKELWLLLGYSHALDISRSSQCRVWFYECLAGTTIQDFFLIYLFSFLCKDVFLLPSLGLQSSFCQGRQVDGERRWFWCFLGVEDGCCLGSKGWHRSSVSFSCNTLTVLLSLTWLFVSFLYNALTVLSSLGHSHW